MADNMSKKSRSFTMSRIRANGNASTELAMVAVFRQNKIKGWRRHQPIIGKPDFVFRRKGIAIFVDGCFWHGCPDCFIAPKSNTEYWNRKIAGNKARDRHVTEELERVGWRVVRIWEHSLQTPNRLGQELAQIFFEPEPLHT